MSERGLYKKGDLDTEDKYVINRNKKIRESKKKSDHKHTYTKIILEYDENIPSIGIKRVANIADVCLICNRVKSLKLFDTERLPDGCYRMLPNDVESVEKRHPELPVYVAVRGKYWNNFSDIKLKENNKIDKGD